MIMVGGNTTAIVWTVIEKELLKVEKNDGCDSGHSSLHCDQSHAASEYIIRILAMQAIVNLQWHLDSVRLVPLYRREGGTRNKNAFC
ncbi:hypothetical protein NC652_015586 [Populus alba x Populus x berolinensis]|nr:hypothetical protein NC652_015586 [Populus alba x Populus x berolinensis]